MDIFAKLAKTFGPRVLGTLASALAGWVVVKTKGTVTVDPETLVEVVGTMIGTYAASHRLTSSQVNPGDAATERVTDAIVSAASSRTLGNTVVVRPKRD